MLQCWRVGTVSPTATNAHPPATNIAPTTQHSTTAHTNTANMEWLWYWLLGMLMYAVVALHCSVSNRDLLWCLFHCSTLRVLSASVSRCIRPFR